MTIASKVTVNARYTRAINLERDRGSPDFIKGYIPTSRALKTLSRIADTITPDDTPRSWSLIGPYGSGKSSFALFLSQLLSGGNQLALKILRKSDEKLTNRFKCLVPNNKGMVSVLITGSPEPLSKKLVISLHESLNRYYSERQERQPKIVGQLEKLSKKPAVLNSEIIDTFIAAQKQLAQSGSLGILLLIDELGKFLEYEARQYGANDIFLLQSLAELSVKGQPVNIYILVMMHQSFDQYAKGLGQSLINEWSKIQGRFEEIPFLESAEQTLRVVGAAFTQKFSRSEHSKIKQNITEIVEGLLNKKALSSTLKFKEAIDLFISCYPFHPISALLLPLLCQKIAQNERTLFSYLGSHEEYGFAKKLVLLKPGEFIEPGDLYDYFVTNQSAVLGDYLVHRRWTEVISAVDRLTTNTNGEQELLKTIGLFNIVTAKGSFKPSAFVLNLFGKSKQRISKALKHLETKSLITYRKFNDEFRVWQGSDFDIERALKQELANLGNFSLPDELNRNSQLTPIVARKYSIENGALRYFLPIFIDSASLKIIGEYSEEPRIFFFLAYGKNDGDTFKSLLEKSGSQDIYVYCKTTTQLRETVLESIALRRVQIQAQELQTDPIAKREFEDRLTAADKAEHDSVNYFLQSPENHAWFHEKIKLNVSNKRSLQNVLSLILENLYSKSPIFHNELINRDRPSSQANSARNKLLAAMLTHSEHNDLGIEKYPAEKAMYRALLKKTEIHTKIEPGKWGFKNPQDNSSTVFHVWEAIENFLESTEKEAKSFVDLNTTLMSPPYGVKAGMLPILYFAYYLVHEHEIALFEARKYRPKFTDDMLERFVKRPDEFTVQLFKISGLKASIFKQYSLALFKHSNAKTILDIARPLANYMADLPIYTQKTKRGLSKKAMDLRFAFDISKSPESLIFDTLPKAIGFDDLDANTNEDVLTEFATVLQSTLKELKSCYPRMLNEQKGILAQVFNLNEDISLYDLRNHAKRWYDLEIFTADSKDLGAFLTRLTKVSGTDEEWFENLLMFLAQKESKKWTDKDRGAAEYRLSELTSRALELYKIRIKIDSQAMSAQNDMKFYLLRSVAKGGVDVDSVVAVDKATEKYIEPTKSRIEKELNTLTQDDQKLAVLAQIVDSFLNKYNADKEMKKKPKLKAVRTKNYG